MKKLLINLTDDTQEVLLRLSDRIADERAGDELSAYPYLRDHKIGPLIEQLIRTHPAVDLLREELGIEWADRRGPGTPVRKKVAVQKQAKKKSQRS